MSHPEDTMHPTDRPHITDIDLGDHHPTFEPEDPLDVALWITVTVGDPHAGSNFQVHVCTPTSIRRITDKRGVLLIPQWLGLDALRSTLNDVVADTAAHSPHTDLHQALSKIWRWEYSDMR